MTAGAEPTLRIPTMAQLLSVLAEAAELEHGVMCGYLYAAFGLRTDPAGGLPPRQAEAVRRWRDELISIAIEEMVHLALVSNLMVALGAHPHFGRQNFPVPPGCHPADIRLALAGFDLEALDHLIFLERPFGSTVTDPPAFGGGPDYLRGTAAGRFFPAGQDYPTIGDLYQAIARSLTDLASSQGEDILFCGGSAAQVGPDVVALPGLISITNLAEATAAIDTIITQGEGGPAYGDHNHFARLQALRTEYQQILAEDPAFTPSWPVATNPVMRRPPEPAGKIYIDAPEAAAVNDAGNAVYTLMLCCLNQAYGRPADSAPTDKLALIDTAISMMGIISTLGTALAQLPASTTHPGINAGLTFEAPRALRPLLNGPSEWRILTLALHQLADGISQLPAVTDPAAIAARVRAQAEPFARRAG